MTPTHTRRHGKLYRYYIAADMLKGVAVDGAIRRVPAAEVETAVIGQVRALLQAPETIVETWRAARKSAPTLTEFEVRESLIEFSALWDQLFPAEQARIVQLLVQRVDILPDGIDVCLRADGFASLVAELKSGGAASGAAA